VKKIIHFVRIHAAPNQVYRALTTRSGLAAWWSTAVEVQDGVGGFAGDFNPVMEVTLLEADRRVDWKCVSGHDNWKDNLFSFALQEVNGERA